METTELSTSPKTPGVSADALVDRLFIKFAAMYGRQWLDMWVGQPLDAVKAEWSRQLTHVAPEQIRLALDSIMHTGPKFPPSLPEFFSLCQQFRKASGPLYLLTQKRVDPPAEFFAKIRSIVKRLP